MEGDGFKLPVPGFVKPRYHLPPPVSPPRGASLGVNSVDARAEARRLLKEAGAEGFSFELVNRDVDQPYKYLGIWLIDQWSKIGLHVTQNVVPTGPWFAALRSGDFAVSTGGSCHGIVNPVMDVQPWLPRSVSESNYGYYEDPKELDIYEKMLHGTDLAKQRALMLQYNERVLG